MNRFKEYEIEGIKLKIPLEYNLQSEKYIENYLELIENDIFTPKGHKVIFAGEDACELSEESSAGGCPDCGSCRFYKFAGEHTWIGVCTNEERSLSPHPNK